MIRKLSDGDLVESYMTAQKVDKIDKDFIELLREELINRSLIFNFRDY